MFINCTLRGILRLLFAATCEALTRVPKLNDTCLSWHTEPGGTSLSLIANCPVMPGSLDSVCTSLDLNQYVVTFPFPGGRHHGHVINRSGYSCFENVDANLQASHDGHFKYSCPGMCGMNPDRVFTPDTDPKIRANYKLLCYCQTNGWSDSKGNDVMPSWIDLNTAVDLTVGGALTCYGHRGNVSDHCRTP
ncbi:hypothetical protein BJ170DRAFT_733070 [Xylariales sp. AK1849]|nr:hypothetical protein BJ170DRAFT_733070 [Xylariales sp. AK1849]